jgi:hypothetical protein
MIRARFFANYRMIIRWPFAAIRNCIAPPLSPSLGCILCRLLTAGGGSRCSSFSVREDGMTRLRGWMAGATLSFVLINGGAAWANGPADEGGMRAAAISDLRAELPLVNVVAR